ncbi:hypothetical protein M3A03_22930, partial [Klebsiella pneumoniae]|nr:hypothetical protein [Klebsiella pneumoniae]
FSELSPQVYKQNGNFIYYIRVPNTNIFVQCPNQHQMYKFRPPASSGFLYIHRDTTLFLSAVR